MSQAQVNFLTCLIGLSISVAGADGSVKVSHIETMKRFFRQNFPFPAADQELIQRLIDGIYAERERIDVQGLCSYYAAVSTGEGRLLLLRLLFEIARADAEGRVAGRGGADPADRYPAGARGGRLPAGPRRVRAGSRAGRGTSSA